jgi:hypothetical protein
MPIGIGSESVASRAAMRGGKTAYLASYAFWAQILCEKMPNDVQWRLLRKPAPHNNTPTTSPYHQWKQVRRGFPGEAVGVSQTMMAPSSWRGGIAVAIGWEAPFGRNKGIREMSWRGASFPLVLVRSL